MVSLSHSSLAPLISVCSNPFKATSAADKLMTPLPKEKKKVKGKPNSGVQDVVQSPPTIHFMCPKLRLFEVICLCIIASPTIFVSALRVTHYPIYLTESPPDPARDAASFTAFSATLLILINHSFLREFSLSLSPSLTEIF